MNEHLQIAVDADTARHLHQRHLSKALHYERLARDERKQSDIYAHWAVQADQGNPVILEMKQ